jgi:hypothetical protein
MSQAGLYTSNSSVSPPEVSEYFESYLSFITSNVTGD